MVKSSNVTTITVELINAIVYKIHNDANTIVYIGVTTQDLKPRWNQHIYAMNHGSTISIYPYMRLHGADKFKITMIETLQGVTRREMFAREAFWTTQIACVNKTSHYNPDATSRHQQWRRERLTCACGSVCTRKYQYLHRRSHRHRQYLESVVASSDAAEVASETDGYDSLTDVDVDADDSGDDGPLFTM
jgi:hypothetical protein